MKPTQVQLDGMYQDFKRGWVDGSSGRWIPDVNNGIQHDDEYLRGYELGREAYKFAMESQMERLGKML